MFEKKKQFFKLKLVFYEPKTKKKSLLVILPNVGFVVKRKMYKLFWSAYFWVDLNAHLNFVPHILLNLKEKQQQKLKHMFRSTCIIINFHECIEKADWTNDVHLPLTNTKLK